MNQHVTKPTGGRPTKYDPSIIPEVRAWCQKGATTQEIADFLEVDRVTIYRWGLVHPEFCNAMRIGKEAADARVERTLYECAVAGEPWAVTKWLNNRMPKEWGGRRSDEAEPSTVSNFIDARRIVYEQLDDASLRAIANLRHIVASRSGPSDAGPTGEVSESAEVQP